MHDHRIAEPADEIHVVFDHAEGVAALLVEALDRVTDGLAACGSRRRRPRRENDLRVDHHGAPKFEELLLAAGQVAGQFVGHMSDLEKLENLVGLGTHPLFFLRARGRRAARRP
jgi:hypothetical protein